MPVGDVGRTHPMPYTMAMGGGRLQDRVALVTGAGQGIGRAIAARLLDEGAAVALVDVDREALDDATDELAPRGELRGLVGDIADERVIIDIVGEVAGWRGNLDILVNNAAVVPSQRAGLAQLDRASWQRALDVNLTAPMLFAREALPLLRREHGCIVNIASTRAFMSEPGTLPYSASKGGIVALTHALAIELGPHVRVNAIAPGWIATDSWRPRASRHAPLLSAADHAQHPVGRVGTPEDIAALTAWLVGDEAGFVTGQVFTSDGGMTRKMIYLE